MRTLLAAILLIVVLTMAAVAASWLTGYVRIEFGDEPPRISAQHPAVIEPTAAEPVADGPQEEEKEPEAAAPAPVRPPVRIVTPAPAPEEAPVPDAPAAPAPPTEPDQAPAPRVVGGPGITPGPAAATPLPREAAPAVPEPPAWTTYRRVTIVGAGEIDLGKRRIVLAGLAPLPADRQCRVSPEAAEHPCAALALQALRQRVRSLGIQCRSGPDAASADCRIGATDLSLWLIEQGWAEAAPDAPEAYGAAEAQARCAAKGLWQTAEPPADCPAR